MRERGFDGAEKVFSRGHVAQRIMNEDGVKQRPESNSSHVSLLVIALGVEGAAHLQHSGREIDKCHVEPLLEMRGVVATAASEFENELRMTSSREKLRVSVRPLCVIGGR
jgi:hypothetical protein